ncbi:MAG: DNA polymerase III subunit beta [Psychrobacillus sp.]
MKFTLPKSILTEVIGKIGRLMSSKPDIPVLRGIHVLVQENCIVFTISDGTESLIHTVPVSVDNGVIVLDCGASVFSKDAFNISKKLKGDITFEVDGSKLTVSQNKTSLEFSTIEADEYPKLAIENTTRAITFEGKDFEDIVKKTAYCASDSQARPILTGVNMNFGEINSFVCTDSHRLAKVQLGSSTEEMNITVPANLLEHAIKSFDLTQSVLVFPSSSQIALANGKTILTSRLLEGNYPDTNRLIPTEFKGELIVQRQELVDTLELLSSMSETGVIKLKVNSLFIELSAVSTISKGLNEIAYESWTGQDGFTISLSSKYLLHAINAFSSNSVKLEFVESMRPFIVTPVTDQEVNEVHLILPVRS